MMLAVARALAANSPALDDVFRVSATSFDRYSEGDRGNRDSGWLGGAKGTVLLPSWPRMNFIRE
jgi:hypothetical protein